MRPQTQYKHTFNGDSTKLALSFESFFFIAPSIQFWPHVHPHNALGVCALCAVALLFVDLSVLPTGRAINHESRAADAKQHLMLLALSCSSALSSCYVTEGLYKLSSVKLASTKQTVMCAHNCHSCPQEMWESMGVKWEWTWYSQTVHAYTEPDLVGANAGSVGLSSYHCFPAAWTSALHVQVPHDGQALLLCLTVHSARALNLCIRLMYKTLNAFLSP